MPTARTMARRNKPASRRSTGSRRRGGGDVTGVAPVIGTSPVGSSQLVMGVRYPRTVVVNHPSGKGVGSTRNGWSAPKLAVYTDRVTAVGPMLSRSAWTESIRRNGN